MNISATDLGQSQNQERSFESSTSEDSASSRDQDFKKKDLTRLTLRKCFEIVEDTIARLNTLAAAIRKPENISAASSTDLYELIEIFDGMTVNGMKVNVTSEFQKYAAQVVALEIPEAENFLKERIAISIAHRCNRFLYRKQHDQNSRKAILATSMEYVTTIEPQYFRMTAGSVSGSGKPTPPRRWENRRNFPKAPKLEANASHFVCPLCLIRSPVKETEEKLWM